MTSIKLPTYPGEGSSHHIVQHIFFFLWFLFWWSFFFVFFLINFFSAWLNLAKDTKLPTYPEEGSSHHVVQKLFFLITFFFWFSYVFLQKGAQCVIVGITTNRTKDLSLKGDMGIQPWRHTRNWWNRVWLISPNWYTFKGNGKTSYTLAALQWAI